jgi:branched-chain amino acid transport system substrate-binding protein
MSSSRQSRRQFTARAAATAVSGIATFAGPWKALHAQGAKKPIKLGLTCDATGQYMRSGQDELRGMRLAIAEANAAGGVLGRPIEWITADTETNPETGARVAERFVTREDCGFLIGAVHSGVAHAITGVAARYGTIYLNSNSSSPTEAGENCHRVKFVWDGNGTNFSKAAVHNALRAIGRNWVLLTNDYVWGHATSAATRAQVEAKGGRILDNLVVPPNTTDFSPFLIRIQQLRPDVVATAIGGEDHLALRRQVAALRMDNAPAWIDNQLDWPDVWGSPQNAFGIFGTTWYHHLPLPGVADFVARWKAAYPNGPIDVPGNVSFNGYMAVRELLRAIDRVGTTNNIRVIHELEMLRIPALQRLQHYDAYMDPVTHQMQQTIYLARRNLNPRDPSDYYEIITWSDPKDVADDEARAACQLTPHDKIPTVEP